MGGISRNLLYRSKSRPPDWGGRSERHLAIPDGLAVGSRRGEMRPTHPPNRAQYSAPRQAQFRPTRRLSEIPDVRSPLMRDRGLALNYTRLKRRGVGVGAHNNGAEAIISLVNMRRMTWARSGLVVLEGCFSSPQEIAIPITRPIADAHEADKRKRPWSAFGSILERIASEEPAGSGA